MRETRVALHEWMAAVLRDNRWTAAEWARRAEVTPTNVTRFLKDPEAASLPGAETIGRLARAAGCQPRFVPDGGPDGQQSPVGAWRVPLLTCGELAAMRALGPAGDVPAFLRGLLRGNGRQAVAVDERPSPGAFAVRISSRHLNAGGVIEDDVIVVEPPDHVPPRAGVLVVVLDGEHVCAYRHYPPLLVPVSTDSACVPMLRDDAAVLGVAVRIIRLIRQ